MYNVSAQGVDAHMINVHYYYYYGKCERPLLLPLTFSYALSH